MKVPKSTMGEWETEPGAGSLLCSETKAEAEDLVKRWVTDEE